MGESIASLGNLGAYRALKRLDLGLRQGFDLSCSEVLTNLETLALIGPEFETESFPHIGSLEFSGELEVSSEFWIVLRLPRLKEIVVFGPGRIDRSSLQGRDDIVVERL